MFKSFMVLHAEEIKPGSNIDGHKEHTFIYEDSAQFLNMTPLLATSKRICRVCGKTDTAVMQVMEVISYNAVESNFYPAGITEEVDAHEE